MIFFLFTFLKQTIDFTHLVFIFHDGEITIFIELFQHTSESSRKAASPTIDLQATRPTRHDVDGNTLNTATPIDDTSGNITVDAVIDYPGDVDVFEFQIDGGSSHLAISSTTPVSAYWIDSSGRLVASIDDGVLTDHTSTHLKTGQYFIVITAKERKSTGRYHPSPQQAKGTHPPSSCCEAGSPCT